MEAGVHYGHQTKRWNPKMKRYIYGARNGIHIIDLQKTVRAVPPRLQLPGPDTVAGGQRCCSSARRSRPRTSCATKRRAGGQFYVTNRWLGGTLTNFHTVKGSIDRLHDDREESSDGTLRVG